MKVVSIRGHTFLAGLLGPDSVVLDLGAHKGEFSLEINRRFGCRCVMVEAMPILFDQIEATPPLEKFSYAVTASDGPAMFFVSDNPEANSIKHLDGQGAIQVEGVSLASLMTRAGIGKVDLLKMDIEGAEIEVLDSASDDLLGRIAQLTVEFHDFVPELELADQVARVRARLCRLGFREIKFSHVLNTDVLFVNTRLVDMGWVEHLYLKYVVKYLLGLARVLRRHFSRRAAFFQWGG